MSRYLKEELSRSSDGSCNLILAVKELNFLNSQEISKLLRESENFTIQYQSKTGSCIQIDVERLASSLPLHLLAMLVSCSEDVITSSLLNDNGVPLKYLLHGIRLLHSLSDLTSRHMRFEQILLEEARLSEQVLDLVFYMLLVLASYEQDNEYGVSILLLHCTLVASGFHLLTSYISSQWQDLVHVLLSHPKIDIFIDAAFDAIHVNVKFLHIILSALGLDVIKNKSSLVASEKTAYSICQHCEASLHFVVSLCQQKMFRDRVLKNKELCKNGGILSLAQTILDLDTPQSFKESYEIVASISRLKSKVLSILLQLCEAESISYLDEVAGSSKSMNLAKSVVLKILDLLKIALAKEAKPLANSFDKRTPKGLVLLNSMRLADIISDDSNFRSFFMVNMSCVLAQILAMPHEFFLSSWCSTDSPIVEEDAVLDYDPFMASGSVLAVLNINSQVILPSFTKHDEASATYVGNLNRIPQASYGHQRTSYLVKIIANLHCFVPNVCEEREKDLFLSKFCECLHIGVKPLSNYPPNSDLPRISTICKNLCSLKTYARSLSPSLLNDDDLELLRLFYNQLVAQIPLESAPFQNSANDVGDHDANANDSLILKQDSLEQSHHLNSNFILNHVVNVGNINGDIGRDYSPRCGVAENDIHLLAQDSSAQEQAFKQDRKVGVNGVSESLLYHELGKLNVTSKSMQLSGLNKLGENIKNGNFFVGHGTSEFLKDNGKEVLKSETGGSDTNNVKVSAADMTMDSGDFPQMMDNMKENDLLRVGQDDEKHETLQGEEKQPRKRKRNIMNEKQIALIENALLQEPEMQRNASMLQTWADKLSIHGSELTPSQLKNWLNNRKARLARAAREVRSPSEGDTAFHDRSSIAHFYDSPESGEESCIASTSRSNGKQSVQSSKFSSRRSSLVEPGQVVSIVNAEGMVVGRGKIHQVEGRWHGKSLEESRTCVVSVTELKVDRSTCVQHPSEAAGPTFGEAEARNGGVMRVAWDTAMVWPLSD